MPDSPDKIRDAIYSYLSALANPARAGTYEGYIRPLRASGLLADSWLKCSEERFNDVKQQFCAERGINPKTGANIVKPKKLDPEEHSKADLIRNVLRSNPDMPRTTAGEFYGDPDIFSSSQFSTIRSEVLEELKKKAKKARKKEAASGGNGVKKDSPQAFAAPDTKLTSEVEQLRDENRYLQWQLIGERHGYFERWLEENDG
jgi:hypothetical protein